MYKHFENYSTYRFFILYSMLWRRHKNNQQINDMKLMKLGYIAVGAILDYIKYEEASVKLLEYNSGNEVIYEERISDDFDEICDTLTGIKISYVNDPVNTVKLLGVRVDKKYYICDIFIERGYLDCLKYAHENGHIHNNNVCCLKAAENGRLDCLKYLHDNKFHWDEDVYMSAVKNGHLDCLKYLHKNGCPWDENTCRYAVENGHLDCLKYLCEIGHELNFELYLTAIISNNLECFKYIYKNYGQWENGMIICEWIVKYGCLDFLQYAHENGCPWSLDTCNIAAKKGKLECLKYNR